MVKLPILLCFLLVLTSVHAQSEPRLLDSLCLEVRHQVFTQSSPVVSSANGFDFQDSIPGLHLFVLTPEDHYFLHSDWVLKKDTLSYQGIDRDTFEILRGADYVRGNLLVLVNNSNDYITVPIEDRRMVLIQEAQDSLGIWRPIEFFLHSDCRASYSSFALVPNDYALTHLVSYCGSQAARMRVRLELQDGVLVSNTYDGFLNPEQFIPSDYIRSAYTRRYLFCQEAYDFGK